MDEQGKKESDGGSRKRKVSPSLPIDVPSTSGESPPPPNFPPWVAGGSPAKFVAPEELLKMTADMDNLALVHEIAIDPNFKISNIPLNPIEKVVKTNMMRAFWDLLREDLAKEPPVYDNAFSLLMEIKQKIHDNILTPKHVRLRSELNIMLNEESLRNKMEQGAFDIKGVASFILELMGRLCCPERDSLIEKLRREEDITELIKGILEVLEIMENDLTNYVISSNRAAYEEKSAKLEYEMFMKLLKRSPDGANFTRKWLKQAFDEIFPISDETVAPETKKEKAQLNDGDDLVKTTSRGYLKLVQERKPALYPETMRIDRDRMEALSEKFLQMMITTSAIFITCNVAGKEASEYAGFKATIKNHLIAISNDITESSLVETLNAMIEQCVKEVCDCYAKLSLSFTEEQQASLRSQLSTISQPNNAVRLLVASRLSRFVEAMLCSPNEVPHRLLPGLSVIERELCAFTSKVLCICVHNRRAFYELYKKLISEFRAEREDVLQAPPGTSKE